MTTIARLPRVTLRFDRLCLGHYRAATGETPHRWIYDITRVTRRVWRVAQFRLQRGRRLIVVDTRDVATLKSGMQWCENAARDAGAVGDGRANGSPRVNSVSTNPEPSDL